MPALSEDTNGRWGGTTPAKRTKFKNAIELTCISHNWTYQLAYLPCTSMQHSLVFRVEGLQCKVLLTAQDVQFIGCVVLRFRVYSI